MCKIYDEIIDTLGDLSAYDERICSCHINPPCSKCESGGELHSKLEELYKKLPILSIRQPWAYCIANGFKDIENRSWPTNFRGTFLIHAGKKWDEDTEIFDIKTMFGVDVPENVDVGGIVGIAEITDCVTESDSPWFFGEYGFVIKNAEAVPFYPCKGQLGFFKLK